MSPADREALPFLAGNTTLIERIARDHHAALNDPLIAFLKPQGGGGKPSWYDLLAAGHEALRLVGAEIAAAKTESEAASATLRNTAYLAAMDRVEQILLSVAVRRLSAGTLHGYGRRTVGGELEPIPRAHWEDGDVDWKNHRLVVTTGERWRGVKVLDVTDLSPGVLAAVTDDFAVMLRDEAVAPPDAIQKAQPRDIIRSSLAAIDGDDPILAGTQWAMLTEKQKMIGSIAARLYPNGLPSEIRPAALKKRCDLYWQAVCDAYKVARTEPPDRKTYETFIDRSR